MPSDKRFTVFHVNSERGLRGGERQLLSLASDLRARGHRNIVVCREGEALDQEAGRAGLERVHLPFFTEWDPLSAWQLRRAALRETNPVLHAHTAHAAAVIFMAAEGATLPRVVHRRVAFGVDRGVDFMLKYKRASKVIAVSEAIRAQFIESGLPPGQVVTIHDGIAASEIRPALRDHAATLAARGAIAQEFDVATGAVWIGNLAALEPQKDHSTLLRALPDILKAFPETYLLIGGEGPLAAQLQQEAKSLGIEEHVRFLGQVRDVPAFMTAIDIFAFTPAVEGFGSVLLEAMARGVPIVTTRVGGIPEVLVHHESALLMPPRDPANVATAVGRLLNDAGLAARLAQKALERVREFSVERMGEATEKIYLEAAA